MHVKWQLVIDHGTHNGEVIPIDAPGFWIGRALTCRLRPTSDTVSRRHCAVLVRDSGLFVVDSQTPNGTFVNGRRIDKHRLREGDRLQVGPLVFVVRHANPAPDKSPGCPLEVDEDSIASMLLSMDDTPEVLSENERSVASTPADGLVLGLNDTTNDQGLMKPSQPNAVSAAEKLLAEHARRPNS